MNPDLVVYDSLTGNAIPTREDKSIMRKWFESAVLGKQLKPAAHIKGGLNAFRKTTEALGTGAVLAAIHVETDGGLDKFGIPLDGLSGALLTVGSAIWPDTEVSADARDIGADALTIWAFRKTSDLLVEKRMTAGRAVPSHLSPVHRMTREEKSSSVAGDPIMDEAAKSGI